MVPLYQSNLINHIRPIREWATARGARATVDLSACQLILQWKNRAYEFQPQFRGIRPDGTPMIWFDMTEDTRAFFGWLPYFNKQWDVACNKHAFKEFAVANGINTPESLTDPASLNGFVVKKGASSFGEGIRGPYRQVDENRPETLLLQDEYYERFIVGKVMKALYWNARPVSVELFDMASIVGNGKASIDELLYNAASVGPRAIPPRLVESLIDFQGYTSTSVPEAGKKIIIDYRYGSPFSPFAFHNTNSISTLSPGIRTQLDFAGETLARSIPEAFRTNTAFSVDGLVDENGTVWFVEMNCNPHLHPDIYHPMLDSLFSDAEVILESLKPLHQRRRIELPRRTTDESNS